VKQVQPQEGQAQGKFVRFNEDVQPTDEEADVEIVEASND
jgi:hypothetical protein